MTQTKLHERFRHEYNELNLGQRSFEKCKPWYVKINTTRNTCCCRYHNEYAYYYDTHIHILRVLHNILVQECSTTLPPTSSREFIHIILCRRIEGCTFYQRPCVDGTFPWCGGMEFLDKCMHSPMSMNLGDMKWTCSHSNMSRMISVEGMKGKKYNWSPLRLAMSSWIVFYPIDIYWYFIYVTTYWSIHIYCWSTRY